MKPVMLCDGSGIRLLPLSRKQYPRHFLPRVILGVVSRYPETGYGFVQRCASLSLQKHFHRGECCWIMVEGTALVRCDDENRWLTKNESVYLPLGCRRRLENPGRIPLHLIEVQTGGYLGEDDSVRFDDP